MSPSKSALLRPILTQNADTYPVDWQTELARSIDEPGELCRLLRLPPEMAEAVRRFACGFPLRIPRPYVNRMQPGDPNDPLLLQVLPQEAEAAEVPGFLSDPLGESLSMPDFGALWKYQGRILLIATPACAAHCRFCFRRHFPYPKGGDLEDRLVPVLSRLKSEPSLQEVILSGGDPLALPDETIQKILDLISDISAVRRVRFHTRFPVMIPSRITNELTTILRGTRLVTSVVVHVNHPAEIDHDVAVVFGRLVDAGIPVLSQGVLLRGVNDRVEVLSALYERLVDLRVMPYYLHQLDRVAGAAHFEVPIAEGLELVRQLRVRLPGYAVPRYVRETPGGANKEVLA